jgi:hypothetical protein
MGSFFIVFYAHSKGFGNAQIEVPNGHYVNHESTKNQIEQSSGISELTIINVIELPKKDADSFYYTQPLINK